MKEGGGVVVLEVNKRNVGSSALENDERRVTSLRVRVTEIENYISVNTACLLLQGRKKDLEKFLLFHTYHSSLKKEREKINLIKIKLGEIYIYIIGWLFEKRKNWEKDWNNRATFERVTSLSFIEPSAVASPRSQYCETTDRLFSCLEARQASNFFCSSHEINTKGETIDNIITL